MSVFQVLMALIRFLLGQVRLDTLFSKNNESNLWNFLHPLK